jgi:1-acyl-sn-glycerol-3-phosphate acyltransferase
VIAVIRSILFALIFYPGSVIVVGVAALMVPFGEKATIRGARNWALWHRLCARWILGIHTQVIGTLDNGQALYVFKHESMYESPSSS